MIRKSLIQRAFTYLVKQKVDVNSLVVVDESALVMHETLQSCHHLTLRVYGHDNFETIQKLFPNHAADINEAGEASIEITIIKDLNVVFVQASDERDPDGFVIMDNIPVLVREALLSDANEAKNSRLANIISDDLADKASVEKMIRSLRMAYRDVEEMTKMRIQLGQRLLAAFKGKLGVVPSTDEKKIAKALGLIEAEYKLLTDGVVEITSKQNRKLTKSGFERKLKDLRDGEGTPMITIYSEYNLVNNYMQLRRVEEESVAALKYLLEGIPIWDEYLVHVKGCGPKLGACIISSFDLRAARYPSSFVKYCGLDVTTNPDTGEQIGRRNWKSLMGEVEYLDTDGKVTKTKSLGYNPELKSKILFVGGGALMKAKGYYYNEVYLPYRQRTDQNPKFQDVVDENGKVISNKAPHRHKVALRYMVKQFLIDLHIFWKKLDEDINVDRYEVAKLGMQHSRKTFIMCLAEAKAKGGKAEDYVGQLPKAG